MTTERVIVQGEQPEDATLDVTLRPQTLAEYVGQEEVKQNLHIFLSAAKKRKEPIEHVLLHGAPGLGKTTLAHVIAKEMGVNIRVTSGPAVERAGDLAAILTNLEPGDIIFIDEIHRLNHMVEEVLYPAMEDFALDIVIGKGPSARTVRIDLPAFTLIGATTRPSLLSAPLRDRFGSSLHLSFYTAQDLAKIVHRSAKILNVKIDEDAVDEVARRSRQTPRVANRLLKRVRDFAEVKHDGHVTDETAREALAMLSVDEAGLDHLDQKVLRTILDKFSGGPVGLQALAASIGEEAATIEDVVEPFLLQLGFLTRSPRGRVLTEAAYRHLGVTPKPTATQDRLIA